MCELSGSRSSRALSEIICDHCRKKGHKERELLAEKARRKRELAKEGGKTYPSQDGGKDHDKGKGKREKGKSKGNKSKKEEERSACSICKQMEAAPPLLETRAELQWP